VKMEKLEIMIKLANEKNIDKVLHEFKEYASRVDVAFVRKTIRAIGRVAIKLEKDAEKCVHVLLELVKNSEHHDHILQESVVVIKDIFRRYPNKYENIIPSLTEHLEHLDEPEAKASIIWILGEYADRIENADILLSKFVETIKDEEPEVQLQILTAIVKLFLKRPKSSHELLQRVFDVTTKELDNPDLRDRGFIYWRLLAESPKEAKTVVLSEKPLITLDSDKLDDNLLSELLGNLSTLSSVYHKPPESFIQKQKNLERKKKKFKSYKTQEPFF